MKDKNGGPAFPYTGKSLTRDTTSGTIVGEREIYYPGITIRDWFAGKALQGLLGYYGNEGAEHASALSYQIADAMLKAREE